MDIPIADMHLPAWISDAIQQASLLAREIVYRFQTDPHLHDIVAALATGIALGWIAGSRRRSRRRLRGREDYYDHLASSAERRRRLEEYRSPDGRTKDDIERAARRRL